MYSKLFKLVIAAITILTINILTTYLINYMINYKTHYKPLTYTLIEMGIMVLIFYPLFTKMEDWLNALSAKIVRKGRSFGGKYLGLLLTFVACISVLFCLYAKLWYKLDVIKLLFSGNLSHYF